MSKEEPGGLFTLTFSASPNTATTLSRLAPGTTFTLDSKSGQYYVVWITQLPPGNRAQISEVTATS